MLRFWNFQTGLGKISGGSIEFSEERIKKKVTNHSMHSTNVLLIPD